MSFLADLATHKKMLIAAIAAVVLLTAYVMPFDLIFDTASAVKGGTTDNDNRFKVCDKKEATGNGNLPKKCYMIVE
jgi:hypothetical protein